jgi:outer membrane protein TolC
LELTTAREVSGQVTKLDVFNAEVQLRGRELNLITTERALQDAYDTLKQIMDVDLEEVLEVEAPVIDFGEAKETDIRILLMTVMFSYVENRRLNIYFSSTVKREIVTDENTGAVMLKTTWVTMNKRTTEEPQILFQATHFDEAVVLKEALDNRLDLLVNRRAVAIEKINTMLQKDGLGQQIDLVGSFSRDNLNRSFLESGNGDEANNWQVGVQFSMPWGKIRDRAGYERALLDLQRAEIALKQARTTVQLDVRNITRRLREAEKSLLIEGKRVEQAKRSVEAAQISFDRGLKDSFDVIRAEDDLKNAKNLFIGRRQNYAVSLAQIESIVGKPTGRVELDGNTLGGLIDSKLPEGLKERGLPRAQPDAEPHPADDPWNNSKQYREDYKPNKKAPVILDEK